MLTLLVAISVLQVCFFIFLVSGKSGKTTPEKLPKLSVIIAARNEEKNLAKNLPKLLSLDYPEEYEVIIALNNTSDNSRQVIELLQKDHQGLSYIDLKEIPDGWSPKKFALKTAISKAKNECLLFTDADCVPEANWLKAAGSAFASGSELILGLSPYVPRPGLLRLLVRFETAMTGLMYSGFAKAGFPYMGVGRNMGYRKSLFQSAGEFEAVKGRLGGDDDLIVNAFADGKKTTVFDSSGSLTWSEAPASWKKWLEQKIRHVNAGNSYKLKWKLILTLIHAVHVIFYLSLIFVLCGDSPNTGWMVYGSRTLALILISSLFPLFKKDKALIILFPILDILYLLYQWVIYPASAIFRPKWNNR